MGSRPAFPEIGSTRCTACDSFRPTFNASQRYRRGAQQDQDVCAKEGDAASGAAQDRHPGRGGQVGRVPLCLVWCNRKKGLGRPQSGTIPQPHSAKGGGCKPVLYRIVSAEG